MMHDAPGSFGGEGGPLTQRPGWAPYWPLHWIGHAPSPRARLVDVPQLEVIEGPPATSASRAGG